MKKREYKKTECKTCGCTKEENFYPGTKSTCKDCVSVKRKKMYSNFTDEEKKKYIAINRGWQRNNVIRFKLLCAKHRAKKKNMEFSITEQDIEYLLSVQNNRCALSDRVFDDQCPNDAWSIDRIDSSKGYITSNIQLLTNTVNIMKNDSTQSFFIEVVKDINKKLGLCN